MPVTKLSVGLTTAGALCVAACRLAWHKKATTPFRFAYFFSWPTLGTGLILLAQPENNNMVEVSRPNRHRHRKERERREREEGRKIFHSLAFQKSTILSKQTRNGFAFIIYSAYLQNNLFWGSHLFNFLPDNRGFTKLATLISRSTKS